MILKLIRADNHSLEGYPLFISGDVFYLTFFQNPLEFRPKLRSPIFLFR